MKTRFLSGIQSALQSSRLLVGSITMMLGYSSAQAATLAWDSNTGTSGAQDGSGTWSAGGLTFWNGTSDVATSNNITTDIAQFGNGGVGDMVNVATQSINGLVFAATTSTGYTLVNGSASTLTIGSSGIAINSGALATTLGNSNLSLALGANQTWTNSSANALTVGKSVTGGAKVLTLSGAGLITFAGGFSGLGNNSAFAPGTNVAISGDSVISAALFANGNTTISAGTTSSSNQIIVISNTGVLTVSGTGILTGTTFRIGSVSGSAANLTVSGSGQVIAGTGSTPVEFNHAGGTAVASNLNLNGGSFTTGVAFTMTGLGIVNFNGGTLKFSAGLTASTTNNPTNLTQNVKAGGATIDTGSFTDTISRPLNHDVSATTDGGLTKLGSGTLILSGANTYNGPTTISLGTLQLGSNSTAGNLSSTSAITNNGNLTFNRSNAFSQATDLGAGVAITGTGALTQAGTGITALTATNTYQGATSITAGTLALTGTGAINSSSSVTINGFGAQFLQNSSVAGTNGITLTLGTLSGSGKVGDVIVGTSGGGIISNNNGVAGASLTTGALTFNDAATVNLFSSSTSAPLVVGALSTNVAGTITINPTAALWNTGTYNLISYTGGSIGGAGFGQFALGTVTGIGIRQSYTFANSGSAITLTIVGSTPVWTGALSSEWSGNTLANPKNWTLANGGGITDFIPGDDVIFGDSATRKTVDISNGNVSPTSVVFTNTIGNAYTLQGSNGIDGFASLSKTGTGILTISTANSFNGTTAISAGTLNLTGSLADTAITVSGTGVLSESATGVIGGGSSLAHSSSGTSTLAGANTYTGATNITAGTLKFSGAGSLASTSPVLLSAGATLDLNGTNQTITLGASAGTIANNSGSGTSVLTFNGSADLGTPLIVDSTSNAGGKVAVVVTANSQNFNTANTYSGGTTVNGGAFFYLQGTVPSAGTGPINLLAANSGLVGNAITIANDITGAGYFHINAFGAGTITLTGALNTSGAFIFRTGTTQVYNFAGNGTTSSLSGVIGSTTNMINGAVATGSIVKSGTGLLTLSGASIYTGTTTISAGSLQIGAGSTTGRLTATTAITDNGNLTINRSDAFSQATDLGAGVPITGTGSITQAGTGTTTLTANNTYTGNTVVSGGTLELALGGALKFAPTINGASNKITGAGTLLLKGAFNIDTSAANTTLGNSWTLVDVGTLTETFDTTFSVTGFTQNSHVWTKPDGANIFTFSEATGVLTYSAPGGFSSWISGFPVGSQNQAGDDFDKDGLNNLLEYALNGNPSVSSTSILPQLVVTATNFEFTYSRLDLSLADTVQSFQYGSDLTGWTPILIPAGPGVSTVGIATVTIADTGSTDSVKVSIPKSAAAGGKLFGRLQVVK